MIYLIDIIECMAVSDNVVNSAFVPPQERDIKTFTDMLTYTSREPSHWALSVTKFTRSVTGMTVAYSPPLEEFDVLRTQLPGGKVERITSALGPTIGIVTSGGAVKFSAANEELELPEGGIIYVVPGKEVTIEAGAGEDAEVWWASYSS
jgi:mannose-6-phosphate isomerase